MAMPPTTETGTQMPGVFLPGNSTAVVGRVHRPVPGPGQLLVEVGASGICGSDIGFIYREHRTHKGLDGAPAYKGVVAGHEPSGRVVEAGPGCRRFLVDDRVIVYHVVGCGLCPNCRAGYLISCSDAGHRAAYGWQRDGGHATYILVEESTCLPLPEPLTYVDGALIACGFGTAYEGLRRCGVNGSDDLLVVGLGPVGLAAAMIGRGLGARSVIGVERSPARARFAESLGLFDAVVLDDGDVVGRIAEVTDGSGVSVSMDCSGSGSGRSVALDNVAEWGRVSLIGEGGELNTEVSDTLLHKQVTIHASWVTSLQGMEDLTRLLVRWDVHPERIVSDRFPIDAADEAYRLAASAESGKVVIIPGVI